MSRRRRKAPPLLTTRFAALALAIAALLASCSPPDSPPPPPGGQLKLNRVVSGLLQPTTIANAGDDRLFVAEKGGTIRVVRGGQLLTTPFLDLSERVSTGGERGLLGLAFDPNYADNGRFYVNYTDLDGTTIIASYLVAPGAPDVADATSEAVILEIPRPTSFHNGGELAFGPDGFLYIASGDGAEGGAAATDLSNLRGKILRLDVSGASPYEVPDTNPFVNTPGAEPEIWAYGLRNPWRFSFDRETGDLYIADVGESAFEELDVQPAASGGGENYGWNVMEGASCFRTPACDGADLTLPVLTYGHGPSTGKAITGGYVYRGTAVPDLVGSYVFGDYVAGNVWRTSAASGWQRTPLFSNTHMQVTTFGEDANGELYLADYKDGSLYRIGR